MHRGIDQKESLEPQQAPDSDLPRSGLETNSFRRARSLRVQPRSKPELGEVQRKRGLFLSEQGSCLSSTQISSSKQQAASPIDCFHPRRQSVVLVAGILHANDGAGGLQAFSLFDTYKVLLILEKGFQPPSHLHIICHPKHFSQQTPSSKP